MPQPPVLSRPESRLLKFWRYTAAVLAVQVLSMLLSLGVHCWVALRLLHPECVLFVDWAAPCTSLFIVSYFLGRLAGQRDGVCVTIGCISAWALIHLFLTTRFLPEFWSDGWHSLTASHFAWWGFALVISGCAAFWGEKFRGRWMPFAVCFLAGTGLLVTLASTNLLWGMTEKSTRSDEAIGSSEWGKFRLINGNSIMRWRRQEADGTSIRVISFDLKKIKLGLYDADSDDSHPFDDRNVTWLGQPISTVWQKIKAREGKSALCLVNGGFFGAEWPYIARHEATMLLDSKVHYPTNKLEQDWPEQAVTFAWRRENEIVRPYIVRSISKTELARQFDGALGGVRVLREGGKSINLKPGMGGTSLRCSRTSVGWDRSGTFTVLSVRDPDGEASSVRANQREKTTGQKEQVGGWDVRRVQQFWENQGVSDAVLFDGGESTQIAMDLYGTGVEFSHSSYHFTRTLGFLNNRPLRIVWPMLPPSQANGGVLNWFYVSER